MFKDFKEFAMKGSLVDIAVASLMGPPLKAWSKVLPLELILWLLALFLRQTLRA